jgi:hypothetical protein
VTARLLQFPARGPFSVRVEREAEAWLVICRGHGWLNGSRHEALSEAVELARGFGASTREAQR